ncbi:hypothetical protein BJV78DRAFT_174971 [Lactifluus subvellereus]|nr:hypothetical protein BJV78DRAFT_174971 [Lactifluus subvellereus]
MNSLTALSTPPTSSEIAPATKISWAPRSHRTATSQGRGEELRLAPQEDLALQPRMGKAACGNPVRVRRSLEPTYSTRAPAWLREPRDRTTPLLVLATAPPRRNPRRSGRAATRWTAAARVLARDSQCRSRVGRCQPRNAAAKSRTAMCP